TTANPQYANPNTGDYRINNTSPCANQLTNTNTPTQPLTTTSTTTYTNSETPPTPVKGATSTPSGSSAGGATTAGGSTPGQPGSSGSPTPTKPQTGKHRLRRSSTLARIATHKSGGHAKRRRHHKAKQARAHRRGVHG
ncbi:MAG TPA: hypothetical protein VNY27_01195, partial [Solirubrobacteraceae bacterium]|nr:hypothetical protein [Solirubrobacteraceae bacterium]